MDDDYLNKKIEIDGVDYLVSGFSKFAQSQIESIQFTDERISQLKNELSISNTARKGYLKMLNIEIDRGSISHE